MSAIISLLNEIESGNIVLPAIQRDFVWGEGQIEKLMDSIMRGYPIGIALLWDTHEDIQYRRFTGDYRPEAPHTFHDNSERRRIKLVLDGQQRLQSLFVALYGKRAGKHLYLDVLSGAEQDDVSEERFHFYFFTDEEANEWIAEANEAAADADEDTEDDAEDTERDEDTEGREAPLYPMRVDRLYRMGAADKKHFVRKLTSELGLNTDEELRLDLNLARFDEVLTRDPNILRVSTIDENLPPDAPSRKTEADVLEIFVRINREGTQLSRSDLIFSMLKLNWRESAEALPEFVRDVNEGNSLNVDPDFVVRCLFTVSDLGSRLDLDVLRKRTNVTLLRTNFQGCCDAIRAAVDFVCSECRIQSSPLLGGLNTLVPFVYYVFRLPNHEIPNGEIDATRSALYAASFARPFSRYADSRIGAFVRGQMRPRLDAKDYAFPAEELYAEIRRWERLTTLNELAQRNELLTLHLVQGLSGAAMQYERNSPEIDHIFPRAELRKKGFDEEKINHYANFWVLARGKNRNKSDRKPKDYFADVANRTLQNALIPRDMLDYRRFNTFLTHRRAAMLDRLRKVTQLPADEFE